MCSVTIIVFPVINDKYGYAPMFLTFGTISLLLFIINIFVMIETLPPQTKVNKSYEMN